MPVDIAISAFTSVVSVLLGSVIGVAATLYATQTSAASEQASVTQAIVGQRETEARAHRAETYTQFLADADSFSKAIGRLWGCLYKGQRIDHVALEEALPALCSKDNDAVIKREQDLGKILPKMYLYASDDAYERAKEILGILVDALSKTRLLPEFAYFESGEYLDAVAAFNELMCIEISPVPRRDCSWGGLQGTGTLVGE